MRVERVRDPPAVLLRDGEDAVHVPGRVDDLAALVREERGQISQGSFSEGRKEGCIEVELNKRIIRL